MAQNINIWLFMVKILKVTWFGMKFLIKWMWDKKKFKCHPCLNNIFAKILNSLKNIKEANKMSSHDGISNWCINILCAGEVETVTTRQLTKLNSIIIAHRVPQFYNLCFCSQSMCSSSDAPSCKCNEK